MARLFRQQMTCQHTQWVWSPQSWNNLHVATTSQRHGVLSVSSTTPLPRLSTASPSISTREGMSSRTESGDFASARLAFSSQQSFEICTVQEPLPKVSNRSIFRQRIMFYLIRKRRFSLQLDFSERSTCSRKRKSGLAVSRLLQHMCCLAIIVIGSITARSGLLSASDERCRLMVFNAALVSCHAQVLGVCRRDLESFLKANRYRAGHAPTSASQHDHQFGGRYNGQHQQSLKRDTNSGAWLCVSVIHVLLIPWK